MPLFVSDSRLMEIYNSIESHAKKYSDDKVFVDGLLTSLSIIRSYLPKEMLKQLLTQPEEVNNDNKI